MDAEGMVVKMLLVTETGGEGGRGMQCPTGLWGTRLRRRDRRLLQKKPQPPISPPPISLASPADLAAAELGADRESGGEIGGRQRDRQ